MNSHQLQRRRVLIAAAAGALSACQSHLPAPPPAPRPPVVGLALGGGAARGFAHVGVIKMLESQGIVPDLIVGTSAGAVVGALYAGGNSGFALQEMTFDLDRSVFADYHWFGRGLLKGQALQDFIDKKLGGRTIEQLPRRYACVAAKLSSGEGRLFERGDVGLAARASSAVPGVFDPVTIDGEDYVDGGTVAPVPVRYAKRMGADLVIAVDVSAAVADAKQDSQLSTLLKAFDIMGNALRAQELPLADILISPNLHGIGSADFDGKQRAILEGERSALAAVPGIRAAILAKTT